MNTIVIVELSNVFNVFLELYSSCIKFKLEIVLTDMRCAVKCNFLENIDF